LFDSNQIAFGMLLDGPRRREAALRHRIDLRGRKGMAP
jgi:hypothetical protein